MCADPGTMGLVHVRFTFDRSPFRRMLRALLAAGTHTRTMQLLPPHPGVLPTSAGDTPNMQPAGQTRSAVRVYSLQFQWVYQQLLCPHLAVI